MIPMQQRCLFTKQITRLFFVVSIVCFLADITVMYQSENQPVSAQTTSWSVTLHIAETAGAGNTIILGGSSNASNGTDDLDLPEPPAPPQLPYLRAWFTTPFEVPFNRLIHEYKHAPSDRMQWNLSILWVPEPGNHSSTTITLSWDPQQARESGFGTFQITENGTVVADMLTKDSFAYVSNGTVHQFTILAQGTPTNDQPEQPNGLPVLPIILVVVIIVAIAGVIVYHWRRTRK